MCLILTGFNTDVEVLAAPIGAYGGCVNRPIVNSTLTFFFTLIWENSYAGAEYLISTLDITETVSDYGRWLDMDSALVHTQGTQNGSSFICYVWFTGIFLVQ